jgi:hypothetical protein
MLFSMDRDMHATRYISWAEYLSGPATTLGMITDHLVGPERINTRGMRKIQQSTNHLPVRSQIMY